MSYKSEFLEKVRNRTAVVGVIGLGYVGLPLAVEFGRQGFRVIGIDPNEAKVSSLNAGRSYIPDVAEADVAALAASGRLKATTAYSAIETEGIDALSICVPTPLRKTRDPDMSYVIAAADEITQYCHPGLLIVLESTTYPGTTEEILLPRLEQNGFRLGQDVFLAFSPERIDPGNRSYGVRNTPKVIGGTTPHCCEAAVALYSTVVDQVVPVSSTQTAEMVKLLENTFRAVNIGLVNEMAIICDKIGVDVWEVIRAASTKPFGFMPFYPGPGLGGHCIPIDPLYLSWRMKSFNYSTRFIELADQINTSMPLHVVTKISDALNEVGRPLRGSKIILLGVAYKRDVDDVRESPALDVIKLLLDRHAEVSYFDPYVQQVSLETVGGRGEMRSMYYSLKTLAAADCIVIITDHSSFDWNEIASAAKLIVDTRNVMATVHANGARVVKL
jgi:UDP-N-acetyl-D-glucosamine dehydrogenase